MMRLVGRGARDEAQAAEKSGMTHIIPFLSGEDALEQAQVEYVKDIDIAIVRANDGADV